MTHEPDAESAETTPAASTQRRARFERAFEDVDPWGYDEPYEVLKYEQTLRLLGERRYASALEVGCAEGHFTVRLAPRARQITAADIAPAALERVRQRVADARFDNISTHLLDIVSDDVPQAAELVVCSEVLYDVGSRATLRAVLAKLSAAVLVGGDLVMAHAFDAGLRSGQPGFGWRKEHDAETVSELMAELGTLQLAARLDTDLYRIERYSKTENEINPDLAYEPTDRAVLEPKIEQMVLWNGYATTPREAARESASAVPILMYHAVRDDGPASLAAWRVSADQLAAQCEFLRYHGYRSIGPDELIALVCDGVRPEGRVVMFTFDDAFEDFEATARPILTAYGMFSPVVFVPTAHLGGVATWDEEEWNAAGLAAPRLLDEDACRRLGGTDVCFGSHFDNHVRLTSVDGATAKASANSSRTRLQELTGQPVELFAYPFGHCNEHVARLVADAGFRVAVTTRDGVSRHGDQPMLVPRVLMDGTRDALELVAPIHERLEAERRGP